MKIFILCITLQSLLQPCLCADFKNLDFQSPNVRTITERFGLVKDIIPGWRLQIADQDRNWMFYNNVSQLFPSAGLYGPEVPRLADKFTFGMKTGVFFDGSNVILASASVFQVGEVPEFAKSIHFRAHMFPVDENLHISMDGQIVQFQRLSSGDTEMLFGYEADVSAWAGKTAELRFTVVPGNYPDSSAALADIEFSPMPVSAIPEPSTWALLATGLVAVGWVTRNSRLRPTN